MSFPQFFPNARQPDQRAAIALSPPALGGIAVFSLSLLEQLFAAAALAGAPWSDQGIHIVKCVAALAMGLPGGACPTFDLHVAHVVGMGSKKQMVWVHTRTIVAPMANTQTIRYFTEVNSP